MNHSSSNAFQPLPHARSDAVDRFVGAVALAVAVVAVLLVIVALVAPGEADAADGATEAATGFVVRGVRVFDGERVTDRTDVLVRDGRIAAVGRALRVPAGFTVVDGGGRTLLPALIDAHTHSFGDARRDALRFGVGTELDMFGDWRQIAAARETRGSLAPTAVADLWSAGTLATVPHGHGTEYGFPIPTLTTPGEAPAFVAARIAEGSDYIKIILEDGSAYGHTLPTLDPPTVAALVAAAHAAHKLAVAHVATEAEARTAIEARVDGLAHVFIDRPASPGFVDLAKRSGVFVVATLSVASSAANAGTGAALADDPRIAPDLSEGQADALRAHFPATWQNPVFLAHAEESVRRLHAAGVPILAGTDAGNPGTAHGASLHGELALLVASGLSPREALAAATALPARYFSLGDRGRIAVGQRADLLLVDGDPTRDIEATRSIVAIWKNGRPVDRALLASDRPGGASSPPSDPVISDFESGTLAVRYGQAWIITTDQFAGGASTATQAWEAGGADGSKGAMRVQGTIAAAPVAWAGSMFMPGRQPFEAVDWSGRQALVFRVRGSRDLTAMLFSGAATQRIPATVVVAVTPQWSEVRIPLASFAGADSARVRGFAITAGLPAGPFDFEIDDVRIE